MWVTSAKKRMSIHRASTLNEAKELPNPSEGVPRLSTIPWETKH